jgi:hypothetical protein
MRWVFPSPKRARYFLVTIFTWLLVIQPSAAKTWTGRGAKTEDLRPVRPPLSLTIVWYDTYNLLPKSFEMMKREVNRLFNEAGVNLKWRLGETVVPVEAFADALSVNVVMLPSDPKDWGLGSGVMGLATHRPGFKGSVYIFRKGIFRTLGLGCLGDAARLPGATAGLARAVARVVAHEVIHFVMPQYPHTKGGLMNGTMNFSFLVRPGVHIDRVSSKALRAELSNKTVQVLAATRQDRRNPAVTTDLR